MNILQILPSLDIGGVETGTVDLACYLVKHGHRAIAVSGGGRLVRELDRAGSRHYTLPVGKKSLFTIISMIGKLRAIIRKEDIDIVHAHSRVPALIAYFACKLSGRVLITTAHGYYKKHLLSESMGWGKRVIVASNIMAKHMMDNFGVPYDRVRLIPQGVDVSRFEFVDHSSIYSEYFTVGMISRITPLKGHADFIRAVSILNRKIPRLKALIVGDAPKEKYKESLELLVRRFGLGQVVEFVPATSDVPSIMAKLDVLVSATLTPEAFGRVIIEAQASGVPVVSTKVGGVVDIIDDGSNGLFSAPHDPKDMAEKLLLLYGDRSLGARLAAEAKRKVDKHFKSDMMMEKTIRVYEESVKAVSILVIKISAIGDVILAIPSFRAIRQRFPDAVIKVLVSLEARESLDRCPYINELIVCDFNGRHKGVKGAWILSRQLQREMFDIVIDLQNNRISHILGALSLAASRYGYDNRKLSFFLNNSVKDDAPYLDPLDHQMRVLKLCGVKNMDKTLEMWPSNSDELRADAILKEAWAFQGQMLVGINVRASPRWVSKNWPAASIAQLCDKLAKEFNVRSVLTGSSDDAAFAEAVAKMTKSKPLVTAGRTSINELAALIKRFRAYLTSDSAPMHIACAVGTPCIALFGPTDPKRHVAVLDNCTIISKEADFDCAPCYRPGCSKKVSCMKKITVEEVFTAIASHLSQKNVPVNEIPI
ncbi:MAG: glycosyltransferase [Candidatus Omnitrophica bacterium]|nr:glycosyltransferase [Candidatus Omnitrophota bacterium]